MQNPTENGSNEGKLQNVIFNEQSHQSIQMINSGSATNKRKDNGNQMTDGQRSPNGLAMNDKSEEESNSPSTIRNGNP